MNSLIEDYPSIIPKPNNISQINGDISFNSYKFDLDPSIMTDEISDCISNFKLYFSQFFDNIPLNSSNNSQIEINISKLDNTTLSKKKNSEELKKQDHPHLYKISIDEKNINIGFNSIPSLHYALVSILQMLIWYNPDFNHETSTKTLKIPCLTIEDYPHASYRGLLIDVARKKHRIETLKKIVLLCYWYKINYLHIHFTDNQSYTLPSKVFPKLPSKRRSFSFDEISELVDYAHNHGVIIIPEIDVPGHSRSIIKAMPELFGVKVGKKTLNTFINIGNEEVYIALDKIIGELCEMFPHSPYIHLGADEVNKKNAEQDPNIKSYMVNHSIPNTDELYRHFIVRLDEIVKKHGKILAIWEGFGPDGEIEIPKDITIFEFECTYNTPDSLLKSGYTLVNTSWKPIYVVPKKRWSVEEIYRWNMYRWENWVDHSPATANPFQFKPTEQIIGAQMCSWEYKEKYQIQQLKRRIAALSENVWNVTKAKQAYDDFNNSKSQEFMDRLKSTIDGFHIILRKNFVCHKREFEINE